MTTDRTVNRAKSGLTAAAVLMAALMVSACGVRGPLEPPGGKVAADGTAPKSAESAAAGENSAAKPKPHEPFVLDGLLR